MISKYFVSFTLALVAMLTISSTSVMAEIAIKKTVPLPKPVPIKGITLPKNNATLPTGVKPKLLPKQGMSLPKQRTVLPTGTRPRLLPKQGVTLPKQGTALPRGAKPISMPGNRGLPVGARPNLLPKQGISLPGGKPALKHKRIIPVPGVSSKRSLLPGLDLPGGVKLSKTSSHLRIVDLGVRLIWARIANRTGGYNEVEVEVINHGSDVMYSRNASVWVEFNTAMGITIGGDGVCYWPSRIRMPVPPDLQVGGRRILLFRSPMLAWGDKHCFAQEGEQPDRGKYFFRATVTNDAPNDSDPNPSNDTTIEVLSTLLPANRLTALTTDGAIRVRPVLSEKVRVKLSAPTFSVGGTGDSTDHNQEQTGELKWIKIKFHTNSEVRLGHKQLSISGNSRGRSVQRRHKKNWLLIRRGDMLYPSGGLSLVTTAREGGLINLEIKARDLDCVKNRDCNRGDNGTTTLSFRIPHDAVDLANCSDSRVFKIASLSGFNPRYTYSGSPQISLDTSLTRICFERID